MSLENSSSAPMPLSSLAEFDHQPRVRLVFGPGMAMKVGQLAREYGAKNVLLVTDPGIVAAGHAGRIQGYLEAAGLEVAVFDQADQNPTTGTIDRCLEIARPKNIDFIIGLGGGSALDTAKGCNFILTNGGRMQDYWGLGKAKHPMLPLIAIPTTGGTGSECQSFALITDEQTHQKMACGDPKAAARIASLDPALTVSQPRRVTACSGVDAIGHAVETAVTRKRTPLSLVFSREAFRLTSAGLPRVLQSPQDLEARGWMLLGAAWGGTAIENSMLGAAHSAANPLTAHFGIPHGQAVGIMLPHVVRYNAAEPVAARTYAELALDLNLGSSSERPEALAVLLANRLQSLLALAGFPASLSRCGVTSHDFPKLAQEAAGQWTAQFNPRPVGAEDFQRLFELAL